MVPNMQIPILLACCMDYGTREEMEQEGATQFVENAKELQSILLPDCLYKF